MKSFFTITCAVLCAVSVSAQVLQNRCGTFDIEKYNEQLTPGYMARVNACFNNAKQIADANRHNRSVQDTIYRIRTVFHVVYTSAAEDIPDSVIYSQIDVLNEDYRRLNADTVRTRDIFKDVAADAGFEFYLADTDPSGNPTTGITHTSGTPGVLGFDPFSENVKSSSTGGYDPWPTDKYLNIWVCNILNGLGVLGYSYPPSNAPNWPANSTTDSAKQGVVLHYPCVGRNYVAPIDPTVAKGRSCTHEVGHYFGLRHIWGDGDCSVDDGLADTPDAAAAHQQTCDTTSNTCPDSPIDFPDMLENYMDYSDDRCLNMFTKDQVGIMHAMVQTSRAGVATAVIQNPTGIDQAVNTIDDIRLFPNPGNSQFNLNTQVRNCKTYTYAVYNAIGETVIAETTLPASTNHITFNLGGHAAGMYMARITAGSQVVIKKFQLLY